MPSIDDAAALALALPGVTETVSRRNRAWAVGPAVFAWERPFSKADLRRFGAEEPPSVPILAVAVVDLDDKQAILAQGDPGIFTIEHFDGYAALLIEMSAVAPDRLREAIEDAWMAKAPRNLVDAFLAGR